MFVVDKVVEEDRRMLLANELESITLPNGTTQALGPAARDAFAIFEDLCLLGNGEHPQFLQLEYLHKTFALELVEKPATTHSSHHPSETCMLAVLFKPLSCSQHSELLLLLQLLPLLLKTLSERSAFSLAIHGTPLAQAILLRAREAGRSHPHTTHQTHYWRD